MNKTTASAILFAGLALTGCGPTTEPQTFDACTAAPVITASNPKYVWTPNAIVLTSQRLADRVYAVYDRNAPTQSGAGIPSATSGGFVVGDNGVLLVESMINRQLFCQMIALVRAQTDKPITHVINTSSHGDHSFGNTFLPKGVHVVQHQRTAEYIAAHFAEDVAFMKMNFGADQGLDEVRAVAADTLVSDTTPYNVDLGGIQVEARYYGFAQTGGDLFVHVPSAKVLWTGNPLVAAKPAVPWLLAGHGKEVATTLAQVRLALPADTIVVPGHDHPISPDGIDFSVNYLNAMLGEVSTSISKGLTVDQTVAAVTMPSYQGYAIWDWVHKVVNVPTTYAELKK
ncbi:MAG: MBL fold metallo-hydrolase [Polyangia bacterium]|jgi:glyoxylase-like metal-dependent hydrolase (beta-lactamase superfamily II)